MSQELRNKNKEKRGFTLIEMIVSLAIFSVVATVALGALVNIVSANKKAQSLQSAITNLNFALETMSREMRVGSKFRCSWDYQITSDLIPLTPLSCPYTQNDMLAFESSRRIDDASGKCDAIVAYRFLIGSPFRIQKAEQEDCNDELLDSEFVDLVSTDDVYITNILTSVSDDIYPVAFIRIVGYAGVRERERTDFEVQTAISPRLE